MTENSPNASSTKGNQSMSDVDTYGDEECDGIPLRRAYGYGVAARKRSAVRRSSPFESWPHRRLAHAWQDGWNAEHERLTEPYRNLPPELLATLRAPETILPGEPAVYEAVSAWVDTGTPENRYPEPRTIGGIPASEINVGLPEERAIPARGLCTCNAQPPTVRAYHDPECPVATPHDKELWYQDMLANPERAAVEMSGMSRADLAEIQAAFDPPPVAGNTKTTPLDADLKCPDCNGEGVVLRHAEPGTVGVPNRFYPCESCSGSGRRACSACEDTGLLAIDGDGPFPCPCRKAHINPSRAFLSFSEWRSDWESLRDANELAEREIAGLKLEVKVKTDWGSEGWAEVASLKEKAEYHAKRAESFEVERDRYRAALTRIMHQPCGHDCPGFCRQMKFGIAKCALTPTTELREETS